MGNICNYQVFKKITQAIAPAKTLKIQMPLLLSQKPLTQKTHLTLKLPIQPLVKASKLKPFLSLLLSLILPITSTYAAQPSPNQIVDREKSPSLSLDKTNNGVDLINLSTPDKNLQSHNVFKHFNVDKKGAILNNSNTLINSKLGGMIPPNPNYAPNAPLAKEILLEVSGNTKSSLLGYLEIAGGKADLILSNPNGIYLNGAGFINTHNLLLNTTANSLHPLYDSKIEIDGLGADLSTLNKAEFITQVAHLNAPLYGGKEVVFNIEGFKDSNPSFGFDARILGSLYAGKITIIANKEGVGVKSEGGLYANADSLSINAKGEIIIKEMLAKENIALESLDKITLTTKAQAQKLSIKSPTLENTAKLHFKDFATLTNAFKNTGELRVSNLNLQTHSLENTGRILTQDLVLNTQGFNNYGDLRSERADIFTKSLNNNGTLLSNTLLIQTNTLNNTNALEANTFNLTTQNLDNSGNLLASNLNMQSNDLNNTGELRVSNLNLQTHSLENTGGILTQDLVLNTQGFSNYGSFQGENVNIMTTSFNNLNASEFLSKNLVLNTQDFNNYGDLRSERADIFTKSLNNNGTLLSNTLLIQTNTLNNTNALEANTFNLTTQNLDNSGNLLASNLNMQSNDLNNTGELRVSNLNLQTHSLENTGGILTQDLVLNTQGLNNQGNITANTFKAQLKDYNFKDGEILVGDSLSLEANNLTLSKAFNTPSNVFINLKGDFHNTKNFSANSLHLQANKVINSSLIALRGASSLNSQTFNNAKNARLLSLGDLQLKNQSLHNQGEILANSLNIHTHRLDNLSAPIQSLQDFTLVANTLNNQGSITQDSYTTRWYYPQDNLKKSPAIATKDIFLKTLDKDFQNLYKHFSKPQGQWISSPYVKNVEIPNSSLKTHKASLKAGGNFTIKAKEILNQEAEIIASKNLNITTQSLQNIRAFIPLNLKVIYGRDYEVVEHRRDTLHGDSYEELEEEAEAIREYALQEKYLKEGSISDDYIFFWDEDADEYGRGSTYSYYSYTLTKTLAPEYKSNYTTSLFSNTPTLILAGGNATIQAQNILNQSFLGFRGNTTLNTHTLNNAKDATLFNNATLSLQAHSFKNEGEIRGENLNATLNTLENKAGKITFNQNASLKLQTLKNQGIANKTYSQKWVNADKSALILENIPKKDLIEPRASLDAQRTSRKNGTWDNSPPEYIAGSELLSSNAPSFKASLEVRGNLNIEAKEILNQEADILVGKDLQITTNVLNNAKTPQYAKVDFTLNHPFRYSKKRGKLRPWGWDNATASAQGSTNQLFYSASQTSILVRGKANIKARKIGNGEILENRKNTQFSKSTPLIALNPLLNFLIPAPNNALFSKGRKATPTPTTYSLNLSALNNSLFTLNTNKDSPLLTLNPALAEFYNDINISVNNVGIKTSSEALASTTLKAPIESNPLYTDTSMLLSSDYFLNKLGFNPKRRFLGDNAFEKILITQSIHQSPKQYLGNRNFSSLKQSLLENALLEQERLGLIAGMPLTQEQRESLDKDILWYEIQSLQTPDGEIQEILVPKLYLAKALETSATIEAKGDLTLEANTLNNQGVIKANNLFASLQGFIQESNFNGAKIEAKENLLVNALSFKNLGGELKAGENLSISTQDFLNQSKFLKGNLYRDNANTFYQNTLLKDKASMEGRNIFIKAQDFSSRASLFKAKDSLFIAAEDISLLGDNSSSSIQRGAGDNSFLSVVSNHKGNTLEAKDMVIFSQGDIKSIGSSFSAQGDLILGAKNLYLLPGRNIESLEIKTKHKGTFKSTQEISFYEKSTSSKNTLEGANIALRAKEDLILYGVDLKATPSITLEGANILQAGVKDTIKSYHFKSSSNFFGLSKREFKETSLKEQAQYALVNSDANLSYKALSSLVLEGVRVNAKRISLGAKTLEIKPLVLESMETKEWSKGTLLSPSFMQESLKRVSLAPSFIESKDLSINTLSTTIKASHIKAKDISINTQALALISLKNRETKNSFSSNASSFLLAKNTKEGFIKEVAMPSTLSFSNSFMLNGRELSKEVQELSNRSNFIAKDKESKARDNHNPLIISSEMPLALDSSMVFSKALLENKQWSERSKSLTPLSHLLLEAALAYVSAGINLPIHSTFVSGVTKASMQGALSSGVFQVSNKLIDSKNALSFRSFTKDTLGGGLKAGIRLLPLNLSLVEGIETLPLREIVLNASVDTLVYKESFKESLLENSLVALGNSLYKGVGDIAQIQSMEGNSLFKEGGLGKVVLHSGVGGLMAALKNENFFKGALISGIYESIAPLRGNPIEHKEREILISKVYGGVVGGLLGGNSLMALGSALSESAERYNRQLHAEDGRLIAVEKGVNDGEVEILNEKEEKAFEEKYKGKVEKYKGAFIFTQPIPEKYQDTYNLNNPQDFETLRSRTDMSYTNLDSKVIIATGMNTDTIKAQERVNFTQNLLGQQVGIIHNDTHGYFKDTLEYKSGLTLKDSLNAHTLQQITKNSQNSVVFKDKDFVTQYPKTILVHSAANEDIKKANFLNATMGAKTNYNLISVGSPIAESELRESTNAVGATLVRQVNDHRDPITNPRGAVVDVVGGGAAGAVRGGITGGILGGIAGGITGLVGGIGITLYNLDEYHSFESYFKNPEFQLQQTIQRLLMQDAMKEVKEKGLGDDKD